MLRDKASPTIVGLGVCEWECCNGGWPADPGRGSSFHIALYDNRYGKGGQGMPLVIIERGSCLFVVSQIILLLYMRPEGPWQLAVLFYAIFSQVRRHLQKLTSYHAAMVGPPLLFPPIYHERAQTPYPDIYGLVLAHDMKISVPFMGAQKCYSRPRCEDICPLHGRPCMWTDIFVSWASNKPIDTKIWGLDTPGLPPLKKGTGVG